jgi:hypothetical protein
MFAGCVERPQQRGVSLDAIFEDDCRATNCPVHAAIKFKLLQGLTILCQGCQ